MNINNILMVHGVGTTSDVRPRKVTALPVASASWRGKELRVEGGAGVADGVYVCVKGSNDSYSWLVIPDQLSDLMDDSTHRLTTDTEKATWNNKQKITVGTVQPADGLWFKVV